MTEWVKASDIQRAILNWQDAVGAGLNGQLEAYIGMTLASLQNTQGLQLSLNPTEANRIRLLLSDNHKTMIKMYLAKQE